MSQGKAPVVVGEWSNWASTGSDCWPDAPTAVPTFLSYLRGKGIGITVRMLRKGVMIESDTLSDTTKIRSNWSCRDGLNEGAGQLVMDWYKLLNK